MFVSTQFSSVSLSKCVCVSSGFVLQCVCLCVGDASPHELCVIECNDESGVLLLLYCVCVCVRGVRVCLCCVQSDCC